MYYSVDSIEQGIAVLLGDGGERLELMVESLPAGSAEGSVLQRTENGFYLAENETEQRQKYVQNLLEKILQNDDETQ